MGRTSGTAVRHVQLPATMPRLFQAVHSSRSLFPKPHVDDAPLVVFSYLLNIKYTKASLDMFSKYYRQLRDHEIQPQRPSRVVA